MESNVLKFLPITEAAATPLAVSAAPSLRSSALAHFNALEQPLKVLAERYRNVAFDVSTPKGLDTAKKARQDLRENGRFAVQRAETAFKSAANDAKKAVDAVAETLIAIVRPVEDAIDAQIKVREDAIAAEKAERERIEAARVQKHRDALALIESYVGKAQGLASDRIQLGIDYVRTIEVGADVFEEFAERAAETKAVTVERLQAMLATALAAEQAARDAEATRAENARMAAELAKLRAEKEAREKADREAAEHVVILIPASTIEAELRGDGSQVAEPGVPLIKGELGVVDCGIRIVESPVGAPVPAPTIKLGDICERLGFTITAAFVTDTLGIKPVGTDKRAVLFAARDYDRICDALINHIKTARGL